MKARIMALVVAMGLFASCTAATDSATNSDGRAKTDSGNTVVSSQAEERPHLAADCDDALSVRGQLALGGAHRHLPVFLAVMERRVAHHREDRALAAGIGRHRVVEAVFVERDLRHRPGQGPGHDVAVLLDRIIKGDRRPGGDPDRWMRCLQRLWHRCRGRERPELAVMGIVSGFVRPISLAVLVYG